MAEGLTQGLAPDHPMLAKPALLDGLTVPEDWCLQPAACSRPRQPARFLLAVAAGFLALKKPAEAATAMRTASGQDAGRRNAAVRY